MKPNDAQSFAMLSCAVGLVEGLAVQAIIRAIRVWRTRSCEHDQANCSLASTQLLCGSKWGWNFGQYWPVS